jgi:RecB family endonuclease NucS
VLCDPSPPVNLTCTVQRGSNVRDVLNRVIEMDIKSTSSSQYRDRNVLSLGYRSKRWHSELQIKDSMSIECHFVNTLHSFFMNRNWALVLSRVGEEALQHILTRPVLLPTGTSYVQVR